MFYIITFLNPLMMNGIWTRATEQFHITTNQASYALALINELIDFHNEENPQPN